VIYLDTSCLLKLFLEEPESEAVRLAVAGEAEVIVSALTELETAVQLRAGWLAGEYREQRYRGYVDRLKALLDTDPFRFRSLAGSVLQTALRQDREAGRLHCRTLDRLHLAAMEELGLRRLMTNDAAEAAGAKALGFDVVSPGPPAAKKTPTSPLP
jgi:predicted nucleic acid-binding protein